MESPRQPYVQSVIRCQAIIRGVLARRTYKQLGTPVTLEIWQNALLYNYEKSISVHTNTTSAARDYLRGPLADRNIGFREFIQFEKRYVSILSFILAVWLIYYDVKPLANEIVRNTGIFGSTESTCEYKNSNTIWSRYSRYIWANQGTAPSSFHVFIEFESVLLGNLAPFTRTTVSVYRVGTHPLKASP